MELLLTGEFIGAHEAHRLGLVSRVVAPAELLPTAQQLAARICANGPLAVRVTKELAWRGQEMPLEEALRLYAALGALVRASEDAREGAARLRGEAAAAIPRALDGEHGL